MPKKKYDARTQATLKSLELTHIENARTRHELRERHRMQLEVEMQDLVIRESRQANEAILLGVTKKDVQSAVGKGNWSSFSEFLALTAEGVHLESLGEWFEQEPYLSNPWNFTKPQYANGFWLYDLTSFYQWAGDPIQMWFGHDTSPGSVEGYSTMSKHLNWEESGPDPFDTVLEQGLPGVPEDTRREILDQFTLAIKKAAGK